MFVGKEIFVFGSNLKGVHGAGAARHAREFYGAQMGVGQGLTGRAYAIATKDTPFGRMLPPERIAGQVAEFARHTRHAIGDVFHVTRVGCGLAGGDDATMAPLFDEVAEQANVRLPGVWIRRHRPIVRLIIAGGRTFTDAGLLQREADAYLTDVLASMPSHTALEFVSGAAEGADRLGEAYARKRGLVPTLFRADWQRLKLRAGPLRNQQMAWYGTHLLAFWDGSSPGTRSMIDLAREGGLQVLVVRVDRSD